MTTVKWSEGKCDSGYIVRRRRAAALSTPARTRALERLWPLGPGQAAASSRTFFMGTLACRLGLPVARGQRKGRPPDGGHKARGDGRPAALVLSLGAISFDLLEKGELSKQVLVE